MAPMRSATASLLAALTLLIVPLQYQKRNCGSGRLHSGQWAAAASLSTPLSPPSAFDPPAPLVGPRRTATAFLPPPPPPLREVRRRSFRKTGRGCDGICRRLAGFLPGTDLPRATFPSSCGEDDGAHSPRSSDGDDGRNDGLSRFSSVLSNMYLPGSARSSILSQLSDAGFRSSDELIQFASDFSERPEILSSVLMSDFGFKAYHAHQARAGLLRMVSAVEEGAKGGEYGDARGGSNVGDAAPTADGAVNSFEDGNGAASGRSGRRSSDAEGADPPPVTLRGSEDALEKQPLSHGNGRRWRERTKAGREMEEAEKKAPLFKSVVVNPHAKRRHEKTSKRSPGGISGGCDNDNGSAHEYGLPPDYAELFPALAEELDEFMTFMTQPSASSQEPPIRRATADVYMRHARLFLGWYVREGISTDGLDMDAVQRRDGIGIAAHIFSIHAIIPTRDAKSAQPIVDFVLWLRRTRHISDSYEANVLRGLTKLLKYRFSEESEADPTYGEKSFHDVPAVRELRKLHRDANRRQAKSPRSSDERQKWLDWEEYLGVVEALGREVEEEIAAYDETTLASDSSHGRKKKKSPGKDKTVGYSPAQRHIATMYQKYLILAFFSCVPDRQRTVRELELGRTFVRVPPLDNMAQGSRGNGGYYNGEDEGDAPCWTIKHGPDDYKTGGTYGDRPPLVLSTHLTRHIDDFLLRWRPSLQPTSDFVFVQPRTGKPLTQDSVYGIVARSCYRLTGKKTNPHLLRDMIVTHVRESGEATERDLEALALYMGHSMGMQRTSYDCRMMGQKVAPAVELLSKVNRRKGG